MTDYEKLEEAIRAMCPETIEYAYDAIYWRHVCWTIDIFKRNDSSGKHSIWLFPSGTISHEANGSNGVDVISFDILKPLSVQSDSVKQFLIDLLGKMPAGQESNKHKKGVRIPPQELTVWETEIRNVFLKGDYAQVRRQLCYSPCAPIRKMLATVHIAASFNTDLKKQASFIWCLEDH